MTHRIRTVIVDDEPPARKILRSLLVAHPQVEIVGEAADVASAAALCERERPDLVFLDVQLPREDGFALLPLLKGSPAVVFVTAYDGHAVRAFEVNALDYLLKPIAPERLAASLARVAVPDSPLSSALLEDDLVALREDSQLRMVPVHAITHILAEDNYTHVHVRGDSPAMVRRTLAEWENLLPAASFSRINRSLIVRLKAIRELKSESRDVSELSFVGQADPIQLGRKAALRLRKALGNS